MSRTIYHIEGYYSVCKPGRTFAYNCNIDVTNVGPPLISWASGNSRMQNSHVILIIVMATHCLVCGSHMQQHCGLICATGAPSREKSHAVNLIGAPEFRTAKSSIHQAQEIAQSTLDPLPRVEVGSGTETSPSIAVVRESIAYSTMSVHAS